MKLPDDVLAMKAANGADRLSLWSLAAAIRKQREEEERERASAALRDRFQARALAARELSLVEAFERLVSF